MSKVRWSYFFYRWGSRHREITHPLGCRADIQTQQWGLGTGGLTFYTGLPFNTLFQNLHFTEFGIYLVIFTYRGFNNCTYAFMTSPWSELWCIWYWVHLFRNKSPKNRIIFENWKSFCSVLLDYYWNNYVFSRFKNLILFVFTPIFNFTS